MRTTSLPCARVGVTSGCACVLRHFRVRVSELLPGAHAYCVSELLPGAPILPHSWTQSGHSVTVDPKLNARERCKNENPRKLIGVKIMQVTVYWQKLVNNNHGRKDVIRDFLVWSNVATFPLIERRSHIWQPKYNILKKEFQLWLCFPYRERQESTFKTSLKWLFWLTYMCDAMSIMAFLPPVFRALYPHLQCRNEATFKED